jgi:localization factor PodJL
MTTGVEDIPQEAREAALEAARRSGMSVGDWLDSMINARREKATPERRADAEDIAEVKGRLAEVGRQLDQLSRLNAQAYLRPNLQPEQQPRELADVIWQLDRRLDQLIGSRRTNDAFARSSGTQSLPRNGAHTDASTPLEQALMEIAERQRALDVDGGAPAAPASRPDLLPHAPTQGLSSLEEQLRQVTTRIETMRPCGVSEMVDTLRDDLAEIGLMVKEAAPRQSIEALEIEVRKLSERLAASTPGEGSDAAVATVERGLAEVRDALRALTPAESLVGVDEAVRELSRKIDLVPSHSQDSPALEQLESAIVSLRGVASQVASDGALTKLSDEVRELTAKVDHIAGSAELLSRLEERISSLATALEQRPEPSALNSGDLDTVIKSLTERIEQLGSARADHAADSHQAVYQASDLGDRIGALAEKLDSSNARLDHLEPIERALGDLLVYLERESTTDRPAAPAPDVSSLRQDVRDTQHSVESMRGALEHLIDRLAGIENDIRSATRAAPAIPASPMPMPAPQGATTATISKTAAAPPVPQPAAQPKPAEAVAAALPSVAAAPSLAPAAQGEHRAIDPSLPPDHPLEPGALRGRAASPSERIAASEAALGATKPAAAPDPGSKASFIAAARRAAQAANSETGSRAEKTTPAAAAKADPKARAALGWGGRVRSVLVALSVVVIVLSSLHLVASLFQSGDEQGDGSPEIQSPTGSEPGAAPQAPDATAPATKAPSVPGRQSLSTPADTSVASGQADATPVAGTDRAAGNDVTGSIGRPATPPAATEPGAPAPAPNAVTNIVDRLPPAISGTLRAAAANGDPAAEYEIAQRFAEGRSVPQNLVEAANWFDLAAKQGLAPAQFRLGGFYEKGFGVKKDLETARKLYSAAADAGNAKAMHNLAVLYAEGIDGKPDYQNAAKWFRKGADYGLTDSQYNLGILYGRGIGMPANLTEAYKWFALAARDGDREAAAKRDEMAGRLDQPSLAAAKASVQAWTAMAQPDAATQAMVPPGGWDAVAPQPTASAKPRHAAIRSDHPPPTALH